MRCLSLVVLSSACNLASNAGLPQIDGRGGRGPDDPTTGCDPVDRVDPGDLGALLVSEVVDHGEAKFVELYNAGTEPWPLANHALNVYPNAQISPETLEFRRQVVEPCSTWVIAFASGPFSEAWGAEPDQVDSQITGNGNDAYELVDLEAEVVLDVYGVIGVDGLGEPWEYEDLSARRRPRVTEGADQWEAGEWSYTSWEQATPGVR